MKEFMKMKKLVSLLLALILLVSAVPALAASLTPEDIIGTWDEYRIYFAYTNRSNFDAAVTKKSGLYATYQFHADGTGKHTVRYSSGTQTKNILWHIKGNKIRIAQEYDATSYQEYYLTIKGSSLINVYKGSDTCTITDYFKKTSESSGKTVKKAILSSGIYKLNNSKKTAVFTAPNPFIKGGTSLKIPDTIKVQGKTYKVIEIAANACANNMLLTTLTVGKNVKAISANAFSGCANLRKITFKGAALGKVKANAFTGTKDNAVVTCPKAKLARYTKLLQKAGLSQTARFKAK